MKLPKKNEYTIEAEHVIAQLYKQAGIMSRESHSAAKNLQAEGAWMVLQRTMNALTNIEINKHYKKRGEKLF